MEGSTVWGERSRIPPGSAVTSCLVTAEGAHCGAGHSLLPERRFSGWGLVGQPGGYMGGGGRDKCHLATEAWIAVCTGRTLVLVQRWQGDTSLAQFADEETEALR